MAGIPLRPLLSHPGASPNFPSPHPPSLSLESVIPSSVVPFFFTCPTPAVRLVRFLWVSYPSHHPKNKALGKSHVRASRVQLTGCQRGRLRCLKTERIKGFTIIFFSLCQSSSTPFPLKTGRKLWDEDLGWRGRGEDGEVPECSHSLSIPRASSGEMGRSFQFPSPGPVSWAE